MNRRRFVMLGLFGGGLSGRRILGASKPEDEPIERRVPRRELDPFHADNGGPSESRSVLDRLTFRSTMQWDPRLLEHTLDTVRYVRDWRRQISVLPPPANSSDRTQCELELLRSYKSIRDRETLLQIRKEVDPVAVILGDRPLGDYFSSRAHPATAELLRTAHGDLGPIVMTLKDEFDRVRPHKLSPDIEPVIDCPAHAAYPSGHSTQAHLVAAILSQIFPARRLLFEQQALAISIRREIAGVHYPSDTAAGASLAVQYLSFAQDHPSFSSLIEQAKKEWT